MAWPIVLNGSSSGFFGCLVISLPPNITRTISAQLISSFMLFKKSSFAPGTPIALISARKREMSFKRFKWESPTIRILLHGGVGGVGEGILRRVSFEIGSAFQAWQNFWWEPPTSSRNQQLNELCWALGLEQLVREFFLGSTSFA